MNVEKRNRYVFLLGTHLIPHFFENPFLKQRIVKCNTQKSYFKKGFKKMNVEKRNRYAKRLTENGIDTLSGELKNKNNTVIGKKDLPESIQAKIKRLAYLADKDNYYLRLNLNKQSKSKEELILKYDTFLDILINVYESFGCDQDDFELQRVDFCFNSCDTEYFEEYSKIHKFLISCLMVSENTKNSYISHSLLSNELLSIAIKSARFEAENYDKSKESKKRDKYKARLELRSKASEALVNDIKSIYLGTWIDRLERAYFAYNNTWKAYNDVLVKAYLADRDKQKNKRRYTTLTNFVLRNDSNIFCRKQLIDLFTRIGVPNPIKSADKYKQNHRIEYFSKADLRFVIDTLIDKFNYYFS